VTASVQDESTRKDIELLQSATGGALPKLVNIDLLPLLQLWLSTAYASASQQQLTCLDNSHDHSKMIFR
jgi:hypothetical protein